MTMLRAALMSFGNIEGGGEKALNGDGNTRRLKGIICEFTSFENYSFVFESSAYGERLPSGGLSALLD